MFRLFRRWNPNQQLQGKVNLDDLKQWFTEERVGKATLAGSTINTEYQSKRLVGVQHLFWKEKQEFTFCFAVRRSHHVPTEQTSRVGLMIPLGFEELAEVWFWM